MSTRRKMSRARMRRIADARIAANRMRSEIPRPVALPPNIGARPAAPHRRSDLMKFLAMTAAITRTYPEELLDANLAKATHQDR